MGETLEHRQIKVIMEKHLNKWLHGITIKEFLNTGRRQDVFTIQYSGIQAIVEITWAKNPTHFLRDIDIIQMSHSLIKIFIVNPEILKDSKNVHYYDKIRVSEILKGYLLSPPLDGYKILNEDKKYMNEVKDVILSLFDLLPPKKELSNKHFIDIIEKVIKPILNTLTSDIIVDYNYLNALDQIHSGLFDDFLNNHYPEINNILKKINVIKYNIEKIIQRINSLYEIGLKSISEIIQIPIINTQYKERITMTETGFGIEEAYTDEIGLPRTEILDFLINSNVDLVSRITKTHFGIKIPSNNEIHIKLVNRDSVGIEKLQQLLRDLMSQSQEEKDHYRKLKMDYDNLILKMKNELNNVIFKTELKFKSNTCNYLIP
jgi:hypothetical protein